MGRQVNGTSLNGHDEPFISVWKNKRSGNKTRIFFVMFSPTTMPKFLSSRCHFYRWYAKRFLHPNIVAQYDYIFIWDEDLDVEHFNAEEWVPSNVICFGSPVLSIGCFIIYVIFLLLLCLVLKQVYKAY